MVNLVPLAGFELQLRLSTEHPSEPSDQERTQSSDRSPDTPDLSGGCRGIVRIAQAGDKPQIVALDRDTCRAHRVCLSHRRSQGLLEALPRLDCGDFS